MKYVQDMVEIDRAYRDISRSIECDLFFLLVDQQNSLHQQSGELSNVNVNVKMGSRVA